MYVGKGDSFLPGISLSELKMFYNKEISGKAKVRLRCAYLRKKGESIPAIASVTGKRESTVSDILRRFSERGLSATYAIKQTGQPKILSEKELFELKIALINPPEFQGYPFVTWTTSLIDYYIKEKFNKSIVRRHLQRILKSQGFVLNNMEDVHLEANLILQKRFNNKTQRKLCRLFQLDKRSPYWSR
jgi:transposase